jgi:hypothetical protein
MESDQLILSLSLPSLLDSCLCVCVCARKQIFIELISCVQILSLYVSDRISRVLTNHMSVFQVKKDAFTIEKLLSHRSICCLMYFYTSCLHPINSSLLTVMLLYTLLGQFQVSLNSVFIADILAFNYCKN